MRDAATQIVRTLRDRGHQAYLVGGCVRDLLLGREPADYDVATDATPEQVMQIFPETFAVGAQFGVVLVPVERRPQHADLPQLGAHHPYAVEVATFRSDLGYSDGRHPDEVRYTADPRQDVLRRDFTINGLLLDPLDGDKVLDFVGGRDDLRAGIIRTIGDPDHRFGEDKLRMLRAVRFTARFGYEIESRTLESIRRLAPEVHQVSRERVREDLVKMLTEGKAADAFRLLDSVGLLHEVLPEVEAMKGIEQPPQFHPEGDVWVHTLLLLKALEPGCSKTLALGALLHDVGKPPTFRVAPDRIRFDGHVEVGVKMAEEICRRLRLSNHDTEQVAALVANHMRFADVHRMKESTFKRFVRLPRFDEHLQLHRLDCLASHGDLSLYDYTRKRLADLPPEAIRPRPLVTGDDLIAAGYAPGPRFKEILAAVEDAQLEGEIVTREDGMRLVLDRFPQRS